MRYLSVVASLVSVAAAYRDWTGIDTKWATHPDRTADWYKQHANGRLPELAPTVTNVVANKSSIVKLECVACPFRVRELHPKPESWQEPPQDNSMLLNFTIDSSTPALLLNGQPIAPLAPLPLHITAFQVPANLSQSHMDSAIKYQMLDSSFNLGVKYGTFELQYEHTVVGTRVSGKTWIQFDITGIIYPSEVYAKNPNGHYELRGEGQKIVQILLREDAEGVMVMEDVQVVERKDREQPYIMECGRLAMAQTVFNPLEWDYYGKIGTWSRELTLFLAKTGDFIWSNLPFLIVFAIMFPAVTLLRWVVRRSQEKEMRMAQDDAEAALLDGEQDDAPPEYEDVPERRSMEEKV